MRVARFCARRISSRPASTVAGAAFAALLTGVALNALFFQKARHPAPMVEAPPLAAISAPLVAPAQAPVAAAVPPQALDSITGSTTASIPRAASASAMPRAASTSGQDGEAAAPVPEPRTRVTFERAGHSAAPAHHGKPAAKSTKVKSVDRISRFLQGAPTHRRHARLGDK